MTASVDLSRKLLAMDTFTALKSSLEHSRKHVLRSLRLYENQMVICNNFEVKRIGNNDRLLILDAY